MSNGYIQISLGGKLRGIKFGMLAIEGIISDYTKQNNPSETKSAYDLVYHGLINNCEAKRMEPDFSYEDVMDWVDELAATEQGQSELVRVTEAFTGSRALQILNEKTAGYEEAKKKMQMI